MADFGGGSSLSRRKPVGGSFTIFQLKSLYYLRSVCRHQSVTGILLCRSTCVVVVLRYRWRISGTENYEPPLIVCDAADAGAQSGKYVNDPVSSKGYGSTGLDPRPAKKIHLLL